MAGEMAPRSGCMKKVPPASNSANSERTPAENPTLDDGRPTKRNTAPRSNRKAADKPAAHVAIASLAHSSAPIPTDASSRAWASHHRGRANRGLRGSRWPGERAVPRPAAYTHLDPEGGRFRPNRVILGRLAEQLDAAAVQIVQKAPEHFILRYQSSGGPPTRADVTAIEGEMNASFGYASRVDLTPVQEIPALSNGKREDFICQVDALTERQS